MIMRTMIMRTIIAAGVLVLISAPAFAKHCPTDVKAITAALAKSPSLSISRLAEIKKLRDEGDQLHRSGKHGASLSALHKAMAKLGIKH